MSGARQQPPQQPPPVQRLHLRYCKRGRARFTSHRDVARALERALRRADVPMAYSSGFNPHPRISYAGASATGAATEADYLELGLAERRDPAQVAAALSAALPEGIDILDAVEWDPEGGRPRSLTDRLEASAWQLSVPGLTQESLSSAVASLVARESAMVERLTKGGVRTFDARPAILELASPADETLTMTLLQGSPLVRPDDVITALSPHIDGFSGTQRVLVTRLAQGPWRDGQIADPLRG